MPYAAEQGRYLLFPSTLELYAFAAGLFEGEGTITISPAGRYTRPIVTLTNTNRELVEVFVTHWPGTFRTFTPKRGNASEAYTWTLNAKAKITHFLNAIEPYVRSTRMKARIALLREDMRLRHVKGQKGNPQYLIACQSRRARMRELNRRGRAA